MKTNKLKKIAQVITGYPFKGEKYSDLGIRTVRGENVTEGSLRWDTIKCWNERFDKEKEYFLKENDVVIGMDGSKVGKNKARIDKNDLPLLLAQRVACLRAFEKNDQLFLYYLINNPRFEQYVFITQTGSSVPHISKTQIENFEVPVIEYEIQQKIAKVLSDLDAKIELNNKINAELEAMAKMIYDYWFVQFDFPFDFGQGRPDANGKPYKSSGGKMVWNEALKREIPEGWENTSIGEITDIFDSMRVPLSKQEREKMKGEIPYYGATGIMDYVNNYIFDGDYILLAEDGSVMDEKGFPIVQYIWGKTWVNNHAHVIKSKSDVLEYLFQLLKTIPVVNILTGSIQLKINQDNLKNYRIIKPNDEIVIKYNILTSKYRKKIINNVEENQHLASLRDWLLPMLMNGQVTVVDALRQAQDELGMVAESGEDYKKG